MATYDWSGLTDGQRITFDPVTDTLSFDIPSVSASNVGLAFSGDTSVSLTWQVKGAIDVNGDGKSDILFQNARDGAVYVWEMDGLTQVGGDFVGRAVGTDWLVTS